MSKVCAKCGYKDSVEEIFVYLRPDKDIVVAASEIRA